MIYLRYRTDLSVVKLWILTAKRSRDELQEPVQRNFVNVIGNSFIFMQENARVHAA